MAKLNEISELSENTAKNGNFEFSESDEGRSPQGNKCGAKNKFIITNNYFNNNPGKPQSENGEYNQYMLDESKIIERIMESIGKIKDTKDKLDMDMPDEKGISKGSFIFFVGIVLAVIYIAGKLKGDDHGL